MLSPEQKQKLIEVLEERFTRKGVGFRCPMCGHDHFVLLDSYLRNDTQVEIGRVVLGGPNVPAAAIICDNCGFMSEHALGVLGLLPQSTSALQPQAAGAGK